MVSLSFISRGHNRNRRCRNITLRSHGFRFSVVLAGASGAGKSFSAPVSEIPYIRHLMSPELVPMVSNALGPTSRELSSAMIRHHLLYSSLRRTSHPYLNVPKHCVFLSFSSDSKMSQFKFYSVSCTRKPKRGSTVRTVPDLRLVAEVKHCRRQARLLPFWRCRPKI
jgi:hypothetical protein